MKKSVYVLLGIPADTEYGRGVIQGIIRFAATTNWILGTAPLDGDLSGEMDTSHWSVEERGGAIALIETPKQASAFNSLHIPCVSISSALDESDFPYVACDEKIIGSLAASHFLERQMRHFGFVGLHGRIDSNARRVGFTDRLAVDGITKVSYHEAPKKFDPESFKKLGEWIDSLSKPVGIFAMNDSLGRTVIDACRACSIRVPGAVAVLGCGNDPVICGLASPSLSSVALPAERVGFDAADMLSAMMNQKKPLERHRLVPVSSVIPRESTDNVSVRDPDVANALRFILAHAGEWIGVRELLLALAGPATIARTEIPQSSRPKPARGDSPRPDRSGQAIAFEHRSSHADRRPPIRVFRSQAVVAGIPGVGGNDAYVLSLQFSAPRASAD